MPALKVSKSIKVNAPVDKVYNMLSDFNHWSPWSPWLIQEPGCKVKVREDAKFYEWEGEMIGSGNMTIVNEKANESLEIDLMFLKPWKSKSKVHFYFKDNGDSTSEVTWTMDGSLPFLMFWMKKMMEAFIGMDYERGLTMLKDYIETGSVPSKLDFKGAGKFDGCKYVGIKVSTNKAGLSDTMMDAFGKLWAHFENNQDQVAGNSFTVYHKWDMVKDHIEYTSAIPVSSIPEGLPAGFVTGELPGTTIHAMEHTGPYRHLGNAWTTMHWMARGKNKKFKMNKKIHPFEVYKNMPGQVPDNELVTEINFATK